MKNFFCISLLFFFKDTSTTNTLELLKFKHSREDTHEHDDDEMMKKSYCEFAKFFISSQLFQSLSGLLWYDCTTYSLLSI